MRLSAAVFSRQSSVLSQNSLAVEDSHFMFAILIKKSLEKSLTLFFVGFCLFAGFVALAEEEENGKNSNANYGNQHNEDLVECQTLAEAADEICTTDSVVAAANQLTSTALPVGGGGGGGASSDINTICNEADKSTAAMNATLASFNHHCSSAILKCLRSCGAARVIDPSEAVELRRNIQACSDSQRSLPYFNQKVSSVISRSPVASRCQQLKKGQNHGSTNKGATADANANKANTNKANTNSAIEPKYGEGKSVGDEPNQRTHTKFSSFDPRPSNQNENQNRKNQGLQNQGKKQDKNPHFLVPELEESDLGVRKVASASKKMPTLLKPSRQDPLLKGPPLVEPPVPPSVSPISSNESFLGQAKRVFKKAVAFLTGEPYSEVMDETQLSSSIMGMKNQNQNREILLSVGPDGITAADGPSLFEKVSMRYKVYRPALIMGE